MKIGNGKLIIDSNDNQCYIDHIETFYPFCLDLQPHEQNIDMITGTLTRMFSMSNLQIRQDIYVPLQLDGTAIQTINVTVATLPFTLFLNTTCPSIYPNPVYNNDVIYDSQTGQGMCVFTGQVGELAMATSYVSTSNVTNIGFNVYSESSAFTAFKISSLPATITCTTTFTKGQTVDNAKQLAMALTRTTNTREKHVKMWADLWRKSVSILPKANISTDELYIINGLNLMLQRSLYNLLSVRKSKNIFCYPSLDRLDIDIDLAQTSSTQHLYEIALANTKLKETIAYILGHVCSDYSIENTKGVSGLHSNKNNVFTNNVVKLAIWKFIKASREQIDEHVYECYYNIPLPSRNNVYMLDADYTFTPIPIAEPLLPLVPCFQLEGYRPNILANINAYLHLVDLTVPMNTAIIAILYANYSQTDPTFLTIFQSYLQNLIDGDMLLATIIQGFVADRGIVSANLPNTWKSIKIGSQTVTNVLLYP